MWVWEPPEVWGYLSLPGTKRQEVSEGCDAVLRPPPNTPITLYFFIPAYGGNGYNGYGAQPMGGESYTSQSILASLTGVKHK